MNTAEMAREWLVGLEVLSSYAIIESDSTDPCVVESLTALLDRVREESEWMEREKCICRLLCFDCVMQDETDWCEMCQSNAAAIRGEDDETIRLAGLFGDA